MPTSKPEVLKCVFSSEGEEKKCALQLLTNIWDKDVIGISHLLFLLDIKANNQYIYTGKCHPDEGNSRGEHEHHWKSISGPTISGLLVYFSPLYFDISAIKASVSQIELAVAFLTDKLGAVFNRLLHKFVFSLKCFLVEQCILHMLVIFLH